MKEIIFTQHHRSVVIRGPVTLATGQTGLVIVEVAQLDRVLREGLHVTAGTPSLVLLSLQLLQSLPLLLLPPLDVLRSDDAPVLRYVIALQYHVRILLSSSRISHGRQKDHRSRPCSTAGSGAR